MFRNYLKTAVRSLLRHRFFSFINIFGLSIAMALSMVIIMLVADQWTYDRHITTCERIYRVNTNPIGQQGQQSGEVATSALPLRQELLENHTGVEKAVRLVRGFGNMWVELAQNVNIPVAGYYADPEALDFFEYELEYGDAETALTEPYTVVLTKKAARKLFKQENPVGETFKVGDDGPYTVTGVIRETGNKSHIAFDALASIATVRALEATGKRTKNLDNWYNYTQGWVYVLLAPGETPSSLQPVLDRIQKKYFTTLPKPETQSKVTYTLQALTNITPGPLVSNPIGPFLPWLFIYFFGGLAAVVMLTSCFNFTNLSIARSLTRAREIGIRKVTGAMRWQVFTQFISESVITSMCALLGAFLILFLLKPLLMQLSFARLMMWNLEINYAVVGIFIVFAFVVGLLAGFFPAVVLSGFQPVKVLKGLGTLKLFSHVGLRKTLLVAQFSFSLIFILSAIVVYDQLQLFLKADHGFSMEKKIVVGLSNTNYVALKTELLKYNNIENVSAVSHVPAAGISRSTSYKQSVDEKEWTELYYFSTDEDYLKNMNLHLVAGEFFPAEQLANNNYIVLNEMAVNAFHFSSAASAIGQQIILQDDSTRKQIIGVVEDYNHQMLFDKMKPMALTASEEEYTVLQVQYTGAYSEAGKSIEKAWATINPTLKIDYKDFNDEVHKIYDVFFGDLVSILSVIAFLAITISCLGLLGMATYATETRIKEISIRKVLGSSDGALLYLLSKGFGSMLLIAIVIAVPTAWFINNLWLEQLAYHVSVGMLTIAMSIFTLIVFGIVTIGSQAWRALYVKPVDNLRGE
ncbi:ABC transporter permease [Parachryseolinea silvisoli]|uniref:ABC transporter permease n=1 Tax=Parachryseolinea silvisoli TaxID=2873601 RepID=UPI0022659FAE|nr:ABC transporter permease [Parachryseolinea silvisoli]MCD9017129.1 ABC transporter permease [Parachryseolinea silvisoli]